MPTKVFNFPDDDGRQLEIEWAGMWNNVSVRCAGVEIGQFADQSALKAGATYTLDDGSTLDVKLKSGMAESGLVVLLNGEPFPGCGSDPLEKLKAAYGMIYVIAALNIILGIVVVVGGFTFLANLGIGAGSIVFGVIFVILGFLVSKRSVIALTLAVGLFGLDGILIVMQMAQSEGGGTGGIIARVFFLIPMMGGFSAIKSLKRKAKAPEAETGRLS